MVGLLIAVIGILTIVNVLSLYALKKERKTTAETIEGQIKFWRRLNNLELARNSEISQRNHKDLVLLEENMNHSFAHFRENVNHFFANSHAEFDREMEKWQNERKLFEAVTKDKIRKRKIRRKRRKAA